MTPQEAYDNPDSIWLSLTAGKNDLEDAEVIYWDDIDEINGDFKNIESIIVTGIPLYKVDSLENATRYIFNQIEIFEKIKENKNLKEKL